MSTAGVSKKSAIKLIIAIIVSVLIVFSIFIFVGLRFLTKSMELGRQGLQYGEGKDNQACLDEALRRYVPNRNPIDQTQWRLFSFYPMMLVIDKKGRTRAI